MDKEIKVKGVTFQAKAYTTPVVFDIPFPGGTGVILVSPSADPEGLISIVLESGGVQTLPVWAIWTSFPRGIEIVSAGTNVDAGYIVIAH
jgi:hypothetical protein